MYKLDVYKCKLVKESSLDMATITTAADVYNVMNNLGLCDAAEEYMYIICLNVKGDIIGVHEISHGSLSETSVHPREIFKRAILNNSAGIIMVHNHPSGCLEPSLEDQMATSRIADAGNLIGIKLVDHVIISQNGSVSLLQKGML